MNTRNALIGTFVIAVCISAYDQYQIEQLKAELAFTEAQLNLAHAATTQRLTSTRQPNVQAAIEARDALWARTRERTPACEQPVNDDIANSCANGYRGAYKQFLDGHPLTQFLDAQQH